jgi:hypothetical protein
MHILPPKPLCVNVVLNCLPSLHRARSILGARDSFPFESLRPAQPLFKISVMLDFSISSHERHERFLQRIIAAREVWGLKSNDGWAVTKSSAGGTEGRKIIPFWSDRAYARQCAKEDWSHYEATPIPLDLFLGRWLPGMDADRILVGTNWNAQLCGHEIEPAELLRQIEKDSSIQ